MTTGIGVQLVRQPECLGSRVRETRVVIEDEALEATVRRNVVNSRYVGYVVVGGDWQVN